MTLDEAIQYQKKIRDGEVGIPEDKWIASCNLGIEALKRVRDYKKAHIGLHYTPMPGETET